MNQTISLDVLGRTKNKPVIILSGIDMSRKSSTNHFREAAKMVSAALTEAMTRAKAFCTPKQLVRALFSRRAAAVISVAGMALMVWHTMSISDVIARQEAVATDCLCMLPWGLIWCLKSDKVASSEKGGRK